MPLFVGALLGAAAVIAGFAPRDAIADRPGLLVLLVGFVVVLDMMRIDVFERANVSPASVPALALAFVFGPLGPIAAEVAIALGRVVRRERTIKWTFDLGALSVSGAAAAGVYAALTPAGAVGQLVAGVVAGLAAYAITSALISLVMWFVRGERPLTAWREQYAWLWPHYVAFGALAAGLVVTEAHIGAWAVVVFGVPVLMLWVGEEQYLSRSREGVRVLRERNSQLEAALTHISELLETAHRSYLQTMTTLGRAVQARDAEAAMSTERVARLSRRLGHRFGLDDDTIHALNVGVVVHDIGQIALPAGGADDPRCPELSVHILSPLDLPATVMEMARYHQERYDGTGHPEGLAGEEIPLAARIVAAARAFDRYTSAGPAPMTYDVGIAELRTDAGAILCPRVVAAIEDCLDDDPALRRYFGDTSEVHHAA